MSAAFAAMEGLLVVLVIAAAVVSPRIELRLWRAGRLSDRAVARLLLGRIPAVCFLFGLILGAPPPVIAGIALLALLPGAVFYRFTLEWLREEARARGSAG